MGGLEESLIILLGLAAEM